MNENLEKRLEDHMVQDNRNFDRLTTVLETFSKIEVRVDGIDARLARTETNTEWLMKAYWAIVVPLAGALVTSIITLIFLRK